jgi:ubiquitin carboxyl-terminal hydrolase 22/27/51
VFRKNARYLVLIFEETINKKVHQGQKTNEPFVPSQLLYLIWTHENHLAGFEEQDAQELLMALFNIIHSQNSNDNSTKIQLFLGNIIFIFFSANDEKTCSCIIDRFFKGALQSEITCSQCG